MKGAHQSLIVNKDRGCLSVGRSRRAFLRRCLLGQELKEGDGKEAVVGRVGGQSLQVKARAWTNVLRRGKAGQSQGTDRRWCNWDTVRAIKEAQCGESTGPDHTWHGRELGF